MLPKTMTRAAEEEATSSKAGPSVSTKFRQKKKTSSSKNISNEDELSETDLMTEMLRWGTPLVPIYRSPTEKESDRKLIAKYCSYETKRNNRLKSQLSAWVKRCETARMELPEYFRAAAEKPDYSLRPASLWMPTRRVPPTFPLTSRTPSGS